MNTRTQDEINRQILGLENEKKIVPEKSLFGTNNHLIIDYQIKVLKGEVHPHDIDEDDDDFEDETEFLDVFEKAEKTREWLEGTNNDDLFNDYSANN